MVVLYHLPEGIVALELHASICSLMEVQVTIMQLLDSFEGLARGPHCFRSLIRYSVQDPAGRRLCPSKNAQDRGQKHAHESFRNPGQIG